MEYHFTLPLRCATKQRPRSVTKGNAHWTYMPNEYVKWKAQVAAMLRSQFTAPPFTTPCTLTIACHFKGLPRGDADNYAGAIMDAANTILYSDDRLVRNLHISLHDHSPADSISVTIS